MAFVFLQPSDIARTQTQISRDLELFNKAYKAAFDGDYDTVRKIERNLSDPKDKEWPCYFNALRMEEMDSEELQTLINKCESVLLRESEIITVLRRRLGELNAIEYSQSMALQRQNNVGGRERVIECHKIARGADFLTKRGLDDALSTCGDTYTRIVFDSLLEKIEGLEEGG